MFDINVITDYINKKLGPVLVLQIGLAASAFAGLIGVWWMIAGSFVEGLAVSLIAFTAGIITAFLLLFLKEPAESDDQSS